MYIVQGVTEHMGDDPLRELIARLRTIKKKFMQAYTLSVVAYAIQRILCVRNIC